MGLLGNAFGWVCDAVGRFTGRPPFVGPVVCPSGSSLPPTSHPPPPSAYRLLRKPVSLPFPIGHSPLLQGACPVWVVGGGHRVGSRSVPPRLPFVRRAEEEGGGGGGSASGSKVASFSVIKFRFVCLATFCRIICAFSSVNYHYSIHTIVHC